MKLNRWLVFFLENYSHWMPNAAKIVEHRLASKTIEFALNFSASMQAVDTVYLTDQPPKDQDAETEP